MNALNFWLGDKDADYGRQFNVTNLGAVPFSDIINVRQQLGEGGSITTKEKVEGPDENVNAFQGKINKDAIGGVELTDEEIIAAGKAEKLKNKAAEVKA